jgi:DNA helicase II / ATP-dependent DNA helicase PcrA
MLDRYRLVSNSDAHSPGKLGREATTFDCDLDYFAIRKALETGDGYVGTVEFFPEEGKYHLDGHRKCAIKLSPRETLAQGGRCPVCGGPMTIGVLHRVEELADRSEEEASPPPTAGEVSNLVPLPEVLGEIVGSAASSKAVERSYGRLLGTLGSELAVLQSVPVEDIARAASPLLAEAITRLRAGEVIRDAGYDGEYGVIRLFQDDELRRRTAGGLLFEMPGQSPPPAQRSDAAGKADAESPGLKGAPALAGLPQETHPRRPQAVAAGEENREKSHAEGAPGVLSSLDEDQRAAASIVDGPLAIVAGPGSGKTRTLTRRIVHLVAERGMAGKHCLAITFTRRAAAEMRERLRDSLGAQAAEIAVHTFHSLGLAMLREHASAAGLQRGFRVASEAERAGALAAGLALPLPRAQGLLRALSKCTRSAMPPDGELAEARAAYRKLLALENRIDFDDLIALPVRLLESNPDIAALYRERFRFVSVDEFQDVDALQYRLLTLIAPPPGGNLCVIGDPHQAIYGFRGADASCFLRFRADYPTAATVALKRNYRSSGTIVAASSQVIVEHVDEPVAEIVRDMHERITIHAAPSERAEAEFVVATIEQAIGGHNFFSIDSGRAGRQGTALSFADFAVLYRTEAQAVALVEALARSGIPFRKHSHTPLAEEPSVRALIDEIDSTAPDCDLSTRLKRAAQRLAGASEEAAAINLALQQLLPLAQACGDDEPRFVDALALATDADLWDGRAHGVSLLTLHTAKGLEFAHVFIVGIEDGILPLYWGNAGTIGTDEMAEERRLFYVGMTRAKNHLVLSRARKRRWRGRLREQQPSPFLAAIESELLRHQNSALRGKPADRQLKLL